MSIQQEMAAELRAAMLERDQPRLDVVRQIETEISRERTDPGFKGEIDDDLYRQVIGSYVKKMEKARSEYEEIGERGAEMAAKLAYEVEYLGRWLPTLAGEDETRELVREAIAHLGVDDPGRAGQVIGHLMKEKKGELDGALVNKIVREELGSV